MNEITVPYTVGDETKTLRIYAPMGGGGMWYVSLDNYHQGQIIWQQGKWTAHLGDEFTTTDIDLIFELMPEAG